MKYLRMSQRLRGESGQVLPLLALMIVALLGFVSIVVDVGRLYVAHQQLVSAVDASALAAGNDFPKSVDAYQAALNYDGSTGANNQLGDGINVSGTQVTFECNSGATAAGVSCETDQSTNASGSSYNCSPPGAQTASATTCNAVKVTQTAKVNLTIGGIFNKSWTISSTALAAAAGGEVKPINAYVILDNSGSMDLASGQSVTGMTPPTTAQGAQVAGCDLYGSAYNVPTGQGGNSQCQLSAGGAGDTSAPERIDEAKAGVQTLLQTLLPCNNAVSCGTATNNTGELGANVTSPDDRVGLLVFPAINASGASLTSAQNTETGCDALHSPEGMSGSGATLSPSNIDSSFGVTYPKYTPYTYSTGQTYGGIPAGDVAPGYETVGLSSDYRSSDSGTNTTLNASSKLVDAVSWADCPSYTYTTNSGNTTKTYTYPGSGNPDGADCLTYQQYTSSSGTTTQGSSLTCGGTNDKNATATADTECNTAGNYDGKTGQFTTAVYSYTKSRTTSYYKATCKPYWNVANTISTTYNAGSWPGGGFYGLKVIGGAGSYLAGAITEAQYLLAKNAQPGVENVIIVVSDGGMNEPSFSGGGTDSAPCGNAVYAAQQATAAGTTVYAIDYGSSGASCPDTAASDNGNGISGRGKNDWWVMQNIASASKDYIVAGSDLTTAFQQAAQSLSTPRLLPPSEG